MRSPAVRKLPRFGAIALALVSGLTALILIPRSRAQDLAQRLILKDGSYQLVTKYEIRGNRVRYYSAEREDWEELPKSLVDWPATEKYEKDRASNTEVPEAVELDKEAERDQQMAEAKLPEVAPGLRLPENSGVFLFDSFQGQAQLDEIQQTAGDVNRNTKANILRGALNPIAGMKQTIELEGAHAGVQSHVGVPSLYISADSGPDQNPTKTSASAGSPNTPDVPEQPEQPQQAEQAVVPYDRYILVHAEVKGNKRVIGQVKRAVTGKIAEEQHPVKTTIDRVAGGWLKLTPTDPLAPGEYALVEMGPEGMNLYVWDFGVDPKAPANANPWKPEVQDMKPAAPDAKAPPAAAPPAKPNP
ncbi:MAG TPA: hypothetical protein VMG31_10895 [Verrucomicrobiae bacterium]|nr:hypothetical protein [Verrucomicrobiae bacterium]